MCQWLFDSVSLAERFVSFLTRGSVQQPGEIGGTEAPSSHSGHQRHRTAHPL